jgi:hypothetical protein
VKTSAKNRLNFFNSDFIFLVVGKIGDNVLFSIGANRAFFTLNFHPIRENIKSESQIFRKTFKTWKLLVKLPKHDVKIEFV